MTIDQNTLSVSSGNRHLLFVIGLSLGVILSLYFGLHISQQSQEIMLIAGILIGGIPHGAIDHMIQKKENEMTGRPFQIIRFYVQYIGVMTVYGLAWYLFPIPSLIVFILITAWHFGETDLFSIPFQNPKTRNYAYLMYGLWVILYLLSSHWLEVSAVLDTLGLRPLTLFLRKYAQNQSTFMMALCGVAIGFWILQWVIQRRWNSFLILHITLILLLSRIPLFIAFTLYFAAWHSLRSLFEIASFLDTKVARFQFIRLTIPNTLLAIFFLAILYHFWTQTYPLGSFIMVVFILLSLLTLPHFVIMHSVFSKKTLQVEAN